MAAERPTLPERLRALAGEPWPFPVPDPDFGMTGNVMREAAQRIEELEAQLAGVDSGTHTTKTHQPAAGVMASDGPDLAPWVRLADSDWVNIVNAPSVLDQMKDKEEAVREAVKLTEEKLRLLNAGPWCCEKGRAAGVEVCRECAEESAGYLAAMSPDGEKGEQS